MKKAELQAKLTELKIDFDEKDSVDVLKQKLAQVSVPVKTDPSLPYVLMDAEDDNIILAELGGAMIQHCVYCFEQDGKKVVGLSKTGVDAVCVEMANTKNMIYEVVDTKFREDEIYFYVDVKVERSRLLFTKEGEFKGKAPMGSATGHKRQAKQMRSRFGVKDDPFAYEKAYSKAERNAKMSLIPKPFIIEMVKKFQEEGSVKKIEMRSKAGEGHLRMIHAVGNECGMSHEKIKDLVKKEFGYDSLNELELVDVDRLVTLMKESSRPAVVRMPPEVVEAFTKKGFLQAKQEAWWRRALEISDSDPEKAKELIINQLQDDGDGQ